jgi:thiol-disulfide isomerase/thioredoxin
MTPRCMAGWICGLVGLISMAMWLGAPTPASALQNTSGEVSTVNAPATGLMRLRLKNNGFGIGKIVPSLTSSTIGWKNLGFEQPFQFDVNAIRSISSIEAVKRPDDLTGGLFLIESKDGQSITGNVTALNDEIIGVNSPILGQLNLKRDSVAQLIQADYTGEILYAGLALQEPWKPLTNVRDWENRAGILSAVKQGAAIRGDIQLPAKCEISFAVAWRGLPDFVISFGAADTERSVGQVTATARLEVWNKTIVLLRETEKDADLARLAELNEKNPQIELSILMDQEQGLLIARDVHGRVLGRIQVRDKQANIRPSVHLVNHGPALTIERLEVRSWNGSSMIGDQSQSQVVLTDDRALGNSWIIGMNPVQQEFIVQNSDGVQTNMPIKSVVAAGLNPPALSEQKPNLVEANPLEERPQVSAPSAAQARDDLPPEQVEVILADRSRLKGVWALAENGLALQNGWSGQLVRFHPDQIVGLVGSDNRFSPDLTAHRNGIIKIGDTELSGYLLENSSETAAGALRWHPHGSRSSSAVTLEAEGTVAYRLQLPISSSGQPTGRVDEVMDRQRAAASTDKSSADQNLTQARTTREIVFVGGDTIDGYVERADENGVHFLSDQTSVKSVPHARVDRVWLNSMASGVRRSTQEKMQRLMTIPRALKDDPPTHLLVSVSGDYLRGRMLSLDEKTVRMEVRSEIAEIARSSVAQIVWLHQRTWQESEVRQPKIESVYQIHVVQNDRGLTFVPTGVVQGILQGHSDLLGPCQIPIKHISQILFGPKLEQRAAEFRENPWVLSLAQLPRVFKQDADKLGDSLGINSTLIGKPAPPFALDKLDGGSVRLSSYQGKVVVLDFWASWCGPCMKTLPVVSELVQGFEPEQVQLLAINIQESEVRVAAAVDRLQLASTVLLDSNGDVAASYMATAIPQTVVIDPTGIVRHVFVGARGDFSEAMKVAIDQLLLPEDSSP